VLSVPDFLRAELKIFIASNVNVSSSRAVSRICHGIGSPGYPSLQWRNHPLWGRHTYYPFSSLLSVSASCFRGLRGAEDESDPDP
jgi:ATP-dependent DNA helicase Q4